MFKGCYGIVVPSRPIVFLLGQDLMPFLDIGFVFLEEETESRAIPSYCVESRDPWWPNENIWDPYVNQILVSQDFPVEVRSPCLPSSGAVISNLYSIQ